MGGGLRLNSFRQVLFPFDLFLFGEGVGGEICISRFCFDSKKLSPQMRKKDVGN